MEARRPLPTISTTPYSIPTHSSVLPRPSLGPQQLRPPGLSLHPPSSQSYRASPIPSSAMSSEGSSPPVQTPASTDLTQSGVTIHSDSETYDANNELSSAPSSSDNAPLVLYQPPTLWGLVRGAAINLFLPFINGLMLGFGELFAHELAFRLGWSGTKVRTLAFYLARVCAN